MKKRLILMVALITALTLALPAGAITDGAPTTTHSEVVLILMEVDGAPAFRCTGTLISPTYVLTAGHCAGAPGEFSGMRVFTEADVQNGDNSYPFAGNNSVEAVRFAAHPDYPNAPFFFNDVGMIELAEPIELNAGDSFGTLPQANELDELATKRGQDKAWFTAVGYGLQKVNPVFVEAERIRHIAYPKLNQINSPGFTGDFSLLLSNNHSTGGTCFGDSGGPNYLRDSTVVAGVTSFGINGNCAGTGGVFRIDRQNVLDFINEFQAGA